MTSQEMSDRQTALYPSETTCRRASNVAHGEIIPAACLARGRHHLIRDDKIDGPWTLKPHANSRYQSATRLPQPS